MTKRQNTIAFILIGTICNIIFSLFFTILFSVLAIIAFKENVSFILPVCLIAGFLCGIFSYQKLAHYIVKKFNLEEKMENLFKKKK